MKELVELIVAFITKFSPEVSAASCGCEIRTKNNLSKRVFLNFAKRFGLDEVLRKGFEHQGHNIQVNELALGKAEGCNYAPLVALVYAWGFLHTKTVAYVSYADKMIRLHVDSLEDCEELFQHLAVHAPQYQIVTYEKWSKKRSR